MKFEPVTIKQMARDLNLGISTVSRALHDSHEISEETKKRVVAYARKLNYIPNPIALSLRAKRNRSIGILISQFNNPFCSQVVHGMESAFYKEGYQVSIVQTNESTEKEAKALQYLSSRVDGLLVSISSETKNTDHFKDLYEKGMPIVFYDRVCRDIQTHMTLSDNYRGAYEATRHLLAQGCTRIGFLGGAATQPIVQERKAGYITALQDAAATIDEKWIHYLPKGGVHYVETEVAMDRLMRLPKSKRPDGLLTCWDKVTADAYRYLRRHEISMPDEVALIGFSNFPLTDFMTPSLSVVQQQSEKLGEVAAGQLLALLQSKRKPARFQTEVLMPEIIIRESSTRLNADRAQREQSKRRIKNIKRG